MAPAKTCLVVLPLFLLTSAHHYLTIHPLNPLVPLGGTVQLNCSINCPFGTTKWIGLDTNLNGQDAGPGYSTLVIENASISVEGTKFCVGECTGQHRRLQAQVSLHVYAFPDSLILFTSFTYGIPYLHCLMKGIYPMNDISVKCYSGSKELDTPMEPTEEEDGDLTTVTWMWALPTEDWKSHTYKCEAQVVVDEQVFKRVGTLAVPTEETANIIATSPFPLTRNITSNSLESSFVRLRTIVSTEEAETTHMLQESTTAESELFTFYSHLKTDGPVNTVLPVAEQTETANIIATSPFPLTRNITSNSLESSFVRLRTIVSTEEAETTHMLQESTTAESELFTFYSHLKTDGPVNTVLPVAEQTENISASSTSQVADNIASNDTTPSAKTATPTARLQPTSVTQESTTVGKESTFTRYVTHSRKLHNINNLIRTTTSAAEYQETGMSTRIPESSSARTDSARTDSARTDSIPLLPGSTQDTSVFSSISPVISKLITGKVIPIPNDPTVKVMPTDETRLMWMIAPASALAGSILIALQIWRQLNRKGFFQPQPIDCTGCNTGGETQDLHSLESGSSPFKPAR
ncbi:mucosal addressin cell adhesion molecule 1 [Hyperolius riggenbachi]|uniref:mucosal addressin cell adhesion molecule 1 n=1 Tax=Hyperolius riggenbachi TaxID=752182 RepID=UPI0035A3B3D7